MDLALFGILLIALGLYGLHWPDFFVGYFNDDASYILCARSLWHGRFVQLDAPGTPPMTHFLPGYPLFLDVLTPGVSFHPLWFKLTSVLCFLVASTFLWQLTVSFSSRYERAACVALFAWHPVSALFSSAVMTEPAYVLFVCLSFWLLRENLRVKLPVYAALLGLAAGWASMMRPNGVLLLVAVAAGLIQAKRWKDFGITTLIGGTVWAIPLLRNMIVRHRPTDYVDFFAMELAETNASVRAWVHHLAQFPSHLFGRSLTGGWFIDWPWISLVAGIALLITVRGIWHSWKAKRLPDAWHVSAVIFIFLYTLNLSIWTTFDERYLLPVLPLVIFFFVQGLWTLPGRSPQADGIRLALMAIILGGHLLFHRQLLWEARAPIRRQPEETFAWLKEHIPTDEGLVANRAATVFLYTHHAAVMMPRLEDPDTFYYWLLKTHRKFVWTDRENRTLLDSHAAMWHHAKEWMIHDRSRYEAVYQNTKEGTLIFIVKPGDAFLKRFEAQILQGTAR